MKKVERDAVRSVQKLVDALTEARQTLRETELSYQRALRKAERTGEVGAALLSPQLGESRRNVNDAVNAIERRRREMRVKLAALAIADDYSIGEMGRLFGFSRQMASRYVNAHGADERVR